MPYPILLFQDQYVLIDSRSGAGYCSNHHYPMVVYPTWIHLPSVSHLQLGWQKSAIWVIMGNFSVPELPSRWKGLFSPRWAERQGTKSRPESGCFPIHCPKHTQSVCLCGPWETTSQHSAPPSTAQQAPVGRKSEPIGANSQRVNCCC